MLHGSLHINRDEHGPIRCDIRGDYLILRIGHDLDVYARPDQLEEIRGVIDAALHEMRPVVPAEACCDALVEEAEGMVVS